MAGKYFETPTPRDMRSKQEEYQKEIDTLTGSINATNYEESQRRISILQHKIDAMFTPPSTVMDWHISPLPGINIR